MARVKLSGFRELEKALAEELPQATSRAVLRRTAVNAMEPLREKMASLAPYDPQDRDEDGNHLNETMRTQVVKAKRRRGGNYARSTGVEVMTGPAPVGKRARANAGWQEDGTVNMAPNSYARPAADAEGRGVIDSVREELTVQVDKAKKRIARKAARQAQG